MTVYALDGVIRPYAWGSRTEIPALLGLAPTGMPAAELWYGAHPGDPSRVGDSTLDKLIAVEPERLLGSSVVQTLGPQLPFILKVLAADTALSIQVHPNLAQARAGYAAEDARGLPRDAPQRNYKDANHKPELLCALTEFDALCGFRPVETTLRLLDVLELAWLRDVLAGDGLRAAFTALVSLDEPVPMVEAVVARLPRLAGTEWAPLGDALTRVARDFPGDIGIAEALLLNFVRLVPGEAIFLAAGNVHSYLSGMGVEIMANSDNVLRCGFTQKHVDVAELLRITDFTELAEPRWPAVDGAFHVPVPDFTLSVVDGAARLADPVPRIVLPIEAPVRIEAERAVVELDRGRAAFVAADEAAVNVRGTGRIFVASTGL
ncbi:MAG TPA: mannose-6-phosphate isomerase, class I [Jatrophihabitantaceae bacterium]|nr:mannose-6-phosphate isomerase, class I [Jatrophihabitantaceae bacterium]